ncbi:MAG: N-acetylglucosamine-6-phosphate deacetylase [Brevinema sp.]
MKAIFSPRIFTGYDFINDGVILWEQEKIYAVGKKEIINNFQFDEQYSTEYMISPGFIDIQVNGAGGADFYGDGISYQTLELMASSLKKFGCTSFCPTLITSSDEDIDKALDLVNHIKNLDQIGILGLHIEGPMFSQEHKGAHNPDLIRVIPIELLHKICRSKVKIVSLSPEIAPLEYIQILSQAGINVSIAHTNATLEQVRTAELYGASLGTHLYNGMSRFSSREPNTVGALLTSKTMFSSIIPDGNHSDFQSVILAHKMLGSRLITITDGIMAMGTNIKKFKIGFQNVHIDESNRCIGDYGGLAGSMITPIECIQNLVWHCEYSLSEALASYTSVPAQALNLSHKIGSLKPQTYADFILLDEQNLTIKETITKGDTSNNFIDQFKKK